MDRHRRTAESRDVDVELGRAWRDHRRHLLDIGFRMLGNVSEAEDAVQEAFARLVRADIEEIDDVGGWLVVVVSRLCLDKLRAKRRHQQRALTAALPASLVAVPQRYRRPGPATTNSGWELPAARRRRGLLLRN